MVIFAAAAGAGAAEELLPGGIDVFDDVGPAPGVPEEALTDGVEVGGAVLVD